jgi:hypothetical protein
MRGFRNRPVTEGTGFRHYSCGKPTYLTPAASSVAALCRAGLGLAVGM